MGNADVVRAGGDPGPGVRGGGRRRGVGGDAVAPLLRRGAGGVPGAGGVAGVFGDAAAVFGVVVGCGW